MFQKLSNVPAIWLCERFLSDEECDRLVETAKPRLTTAFFATLESPTARIHDQRRTCTTTYVLDTEAEEICSRIAERIGMPGENCEPLEVMRYEPGQHFALHYDYGAEPEKGNRIATMILFLSDVDEGGRTLFPLVDVAVEPRKGSALFFMNVDEKGKPDTKSLHCGEIVRKGEKWIATRWIRDRKCQ